MGVAGRALAALIGRPLELPPAILAAFPELAAARWRAGGLPLRIGGWALGTRTVAGITLGRTIWLAPDARLDPSLLLHELRHVHQFQGSPAFPLQYLWESLTRGYQRNRFEADARQYAELRVRNAGSSDIPPELQP